MCEKGAVPTEWRGSPVNLGHAALQSKVKKRCVHVHVRVHVRACVHACCHRHEQQAPVSRCNPLPCQGKLVIQWKENTLLPLFWKSVLRFIFQMRSRSQPSKSPRDCPCLALAHEGRQSQAKPSCRVQPGHTRSPRQTTQGRLTHFF